MRRAITLLVIGALGLFVGGSARAGYIEVTYSIIGSTLETVPDGMAWAADTDYIGTGSFLTFRFGAATASATLTSALLVSGFQKVEIDNAVGGFAHLHGETNTTLYPGGGVVATLSGNRIIGTGTFGTGTSAQTGLIPAPSTTTGYIHCDSGMCGVVGFGPMSQNYPQSRSSTFFVPQMIFTSTAGVGNWTGVFTMHDDNAGAQLNFSYVGREIGRTFVVPEPATSSLAALGLAGLVALNWYTRRQRR